MPINPQAIRGPVTAVPVVAGTGVRFVEDADNNRVVAEVDETLLYSGGTTSSATLSETAANFERLRIEVKASAFTTTDTIVAMVDVGKFSVCFMGDAADMYAGTGTISGTSVTITEGKHIWFNAGGSGSETALALITRVWGINRIASN